MAGAETVLADISGPAAREARPPPTALTLVFTDIEGSTRILRLLGDGYAAALDAHRRLLRALVARHEGREVDTEGDGCFIVFPRADAAVSFAAACQAALAGHPWPQGVALRVRIGIHTGCASPHDGGYVGLDVHRAARICAAAHGGQVVLSGATADLLASGGTDDVTLEDLGSHQLKDLPESERLFQLVVAGLPSAFRRCVCSPTRQPSR